MAQAMTPSHSITQDRVTPAQLAKAQEIVAAALRKSRRLYCYPFQMTLEHQGKNLVRDLAAVFEKYAGVMVRTWKADRDLSPQEVMGATECDYGPSNGPGKVDERVLASMPCGEGEEGETIFFRLDHGLDYNSSDDEISVTNAQLEKEFAVRGLVPEYPDNLAALNAADHSLAEDNMQYLTYWIDDRGRKCVMAFGPYDGGGRPVYVAVSTHDTQYIQDVWFAGRRA